MFKLPIMVRTGRPQGDDIIVSVTYINLDGQAEHPYPIMSLQSDQVYVLTNFKAGNIADLSGGDNRSIIGYDYHGGDNQKWQFQQVDGGEWTIRSVGTGKYLGVDGEPRDGAPVVAVDEPFKWDIWPDDKHTETFRIFVHDTKFNVDLSDHGNATPGTPVTLWSKWHGENQLWRLAPPQ
ncbi:carbohydrate-binding module family 13 protein [Auriscalpium vulgare]|uniref:Carbohydrate-binding module family 13 protein n=1 Tax=Auriscalpium vulgare TaxID=40419 RepID=A0ACB8RYC7_9AGAM|nr:carbohydrate-binding module family 13 protein [Auriscalpium vulgare]